MGDLEGVVPPELSQLKNLTSLNLSWNKLGGNLPLTIGVLKAKGCKVDLRGNKGFTLPTDTSMVAAEKNLDLSGCSLGGVLPLEVILLKVRGCHVKLGGNLPGLALPQNVGDLVDYENIRFLNLACCSLNGKVPSSFINLTGLEELLLRHNSLTGCLPDELKASEIKIQVQHTKIRDDAPPPLFGLGRKGMSPPGAMIMRAPQMGR